MFCSNITGSCSEWEGATAHQVEQLLNVLGLDKNDKESKAALWTVINSLQMTLIYNRVAGRNVEALQASRWVYGLWQMRLSQEQWKVELEHWFQTALTVMQMTPLRVVSIPGLDRTRVERLQPIYPELYADACSMVKFYSPSHATVSLLRVILILVFSTLLILVSHIDWICYKIGSARMRRLVSSGEENDARRLLLTVERQVSTRRNPTACRLNSNTSSRTLKLMTMKAFTTWNVSERTLVHPLK